MSLPQSLDGLTPAFLNEAMGTSLGGATVTEVSYDDIGVGVGVFGIIGRLHLTVEGGDSTAPAKVIAKMPIDAEANRQIGLALGLYEREHRFYDEASDTVPFPIPTCYFTSGDPESGEYLLLLEDVGHLEEGDQLAGLSPERAEALIDALAAFHATWWESDALYAQDWLPQQDAPMYKASVPGIVTAGTAALPPLEAELPAGSLELAGTVAANFEELIDRCAASPRTFIHGDARLDNVFFTPGTNDFLLIDWQLPLKCRGIYDVVWLLATSMDIEVQNAHADRLLMHYQAALASNGVDWPEAELRAAAAEQAAYLLSGPLSLVGTFDFSEAGDGRAAQLTKKWVARGFNLALLYGSGDIF